MRLAHGIRRALVQARHDRCRVTRVRRATQRIARAGFAVRELVLNEPQLLVERRAVNIVPRPALERRGRLL